MQYKKYAFIIVVLMGLITLWSCEYEKIEPVPLPPITDSLSYSANIQPIFNSDCAGCHGVGMTAPDLTAANSYNSLINGGFVLPGDADDSKLYTEMASGGGMSAYTNTSDANLVFTWIQQGAKNN
jgi:hypothetical protein